MYRTKNASRVLYTCRLAFSGDNLVLPPHRVQWVQLVLQDKSDEDGDFRAWQVIDGTGADEDEGTSTFFELRVFFDVVEETKQRLTSDAHRDQ